MVQVSRTPSRERVAMLAWTARIGAVTAEALAQLEGTTVASARARLSVAVRERMLSRTQPLLGQPALYTITRTGLQASGLSGFDPCRVSAASAQHMIVCARTAAALHRGFPEHSVMGERELRREERLSGAPLASAVLGPAAARGQLLHRPDLILWPRAGGDYRPIPVEVELTVKAPRRLTDICRAWARARHVAGVLYLVAPGVERALGRAIETAHAGGRIVAVPLDALPQADARTLASIARTVPSGP